ncbi:MAG: effector-associated domain EAD1-containing protein [Saprospiraceae bacterium]|nr:effector-associated domain EAD1-containing protein [Saprospiraceae bacterium]
MNKRELVNRLAELISNPETAKMVVDFAGLSKEKFDFTGNPKSMWFKVVSEADKHKDGLLQLVESALGEYEGDEVLVKIKNSLSPQKPPSSNGGGSENNTLSVSAMKLKELIANRRIDAVLQILVKESPKLSSSAQNELILLNSRHAQMKSDERKGVVSAADLSINENKLVNALLQFIDMITE